ncbi:MAG TPA: DUF1499 domain-containing protein [Stellaceae bacterium]|nr:DUF1499 domain-containing protein [Stellaceae bacterium]
MTTAMTTPGSSTKRVGFARAAATIGLLLGAAAVLLLAAGPFGWRFGWWSFRLAFTTLMPCAFYGGCAAIVVSVIAVAGSLGRRARGSVAEAVLGLVLGAIAAYFPWHASEMRGVYPPMHDITTDAANPPSFEFAAGMRVAEHGAGVAYPSDAAAMQQKYYPGIEPALLDVPPAQAFGRALAVVKAKGWTIVKTEPEDGVIDAYDRSLWFGFADDVAIRVSASGSGSRVDIRSGSRQGRGDFGVNAARVRGFLAALKQEK